MTRMTRAIDEEAVAVAKRVPSSLMRRLVFTLVLLLPVVTGWRVAQRWPDPDVSFFEGTAQLLAALFIAMAVELSTPGEKVWQETLDKAMLLVLLATGWLGLFGCLRAMFSGHGSALLSGLSGAGLIAASTLVSLAWLSHLHLGAGRLAAIVLIFLVPPSFVLAVLP